MNVSLHNEKRTARCILADVFILWSPNQKKYQWNLFVFHEEKPSDSNAWKAGWGGGVEWSSDACIVSLFYGRPLLQFDDEWMAEMCTNGNNCTSTPTSLVINLVPCFCLSFTDKRENREHSHMCVNRPNKSTRIVSSAIIFRFYHSMTLYGRRVFCSGNFHESCNWRSVECVLFDVDIYSVRFSRIDWWQMSTAFQTDKFAGIID